MSDLIFYTNPQSRGRIVRWMLEEVGEPYEARDLDYARPQGRGLSLGQPDGEGPGDPSQRPDGDRVRRDLRYLADVFPKRVSGLATDEKADYYRWMFFAAGPVEAAVSNKAMGWEPTPERERMFGYGNFDRAIGVSTRCCRRAIMSAATGSPQPMSMSGRS